MRGKALADGLRKAAGDIQLTRRLSAEGTLRELVAGLGPEILDG